MRSLDDEMLARLFSVQYASLHEDLPLWLALAAESGSPILEIGCGAGRVLRPLAEAGHSVTGLDRSPAMLRLAGTAVAGRLAERTSLVEADVRRFNLDRLFRLILSPCNTLSALDDAELAAALERIHAHLYPGGRLAFEVPGPGEELVGADWDEPLAAFIDTESGNPVQVFASQQAEPGAGRVKVNWRYDVLKPDGAVQSWELSVPFHLRPPEAYARMLEQAGLQAIALHGDYDRRPLRPGDTCLIVVAGKAD